MYILYKDMYIDDVYTRSKQYIVSALIMHGFIVVICISSISSVSVVISVVIIIVIVL